MRLSKILGDLFRVKIRLKWAIIPFFKCSKILGEIPKIEVGCPSFIDPLKTEIMQVELWPGMIAIFTLLAEGIRDTDLVFLEWRRNIY